MAKETGKKKEVWDRHRIRALRHQMGWSQRQMAEALGTRQQTVSEWEVGLYQPRGTSAKLLSLVAERAGFQYDTSPPTATGEKGESSQ